MVPHLRGKVASQLCSSLTCPSRIRVSTRLKWADLVDLRLGLCFWGKINGDPTFSFLGFLPQGSVQCSHDPCFSRVQVAFVA